MTTVVRGGVVVTARAAFRADVLIDGGRILAVASDLRGDTEIDAGGCFVMPGGVDTHTHLEHMSANGHTRTADDFASGSLAALAGGTTTIVDFSRTLPGETVTQAYARRKAQAARGCVVDYAFHPIVPAAADTDVFDELEELARTEGATSWKFFMAYPGSMVDDAVLIEGMRRARASGVLPMVHAENGHIVADAVAGLVAAGTTEEHLHTQAHPVGAEVEAIGRAAAVADWVGTPVFVVHVSSGPGADRIAALRAAGTAILGETCPHYLAVAYEEYASRGFDAAAYVCSPPIRERAHQERLWERLGDEALATIGTDHAAFSMDQPEDLPPQKPQGRGDFTRIPNGVPGVEERLMLIWHLGVATGRLTPSQFVDLVATRPAQIFGLAPRKGVIAPGADADLLVWDPAASRTLRSDQMRTRAGYTLYDGLTVSGSPRAVLAHGEVVAIGSALQAEAARGSYLRRRRFDRATFERRAG